VASVRQHGKPAPARRVAFEVLTRVQAGAYASELLMEKAAQLEARDAGLAAEITLGVLRRQGQLDFLIEHFSGRPIEKLDVEVLLALRMALYQVRFLDRVPHYAAINDSLNLLHAARKASAVAFANAILRKATADVEVEIPTGHAVPVWLLEKWIGDFDRETALKIAAASLEVPRLYQHVPAGSEPPFGGGETDVPQCFQIDSPDPRYRIQDIGSQAIVPLLELEAGNRFLDVCAAPGNKTAQALETTSHIVAADASLPRLKGLKGLAVPLVLADATRPLPFAPGAFDRILVDAPCSGTGTLAHNPEIKWRLAAEDLPRFSERQRQILRNALDVLAPGGLLVYSTCSLEPEENEQVTAGVRDRVQREIRRIPGRDAGDGFYAAVIR
jgi:16S rRNA (cytosine967-C5)-methyltransferase